MNTCKFELQETCDESIGCTNCIMQIIEKEFIKRFEEYKCTWIKDDEDDKYCTLAREECIALIHEYISDKEEHPKYEFCKECKSSGFCTDCVLNKIASKAAYYANYHNGIYRYKGHVNRKYYKQYMMCYETLFDTICSYQGLYVKNYCKLVLKGELTWD